MPKNQFQCQLCPKTFPNMYHFKIHMKAHSGERPHSCDKCGKCFLHKKSLRLHIEKVHVAAEKPYLCKFCETRFSESNAYDEHMKTHAGEENWFPCDICKKRFPQLQTLLLHLREHAADSNKRKDNLYSCSFCDLSFSLKTDLKKHMEGHVGVVKCHACEYCGKRFGQKVQLVIHMRTHTGEKPFSCEFCEKRFCQKVQLVIHMRTHTGEKPFSCEYCKKCFVTKTLLNNHLRVHTKERPYACEYCDRCFAKNSNKRRHIKVVHGFVNTSSEVTGDESFDIQASCSKDYKLQGHVKTYNDNSQHACGYCEETFTEEVCWKEHMAMVHGMEFNNYEDYDEVNVMYVVYPNEGQSKEVVMKTTKGGCET